MYPFITQIQEFKKTAHNWTDFLQEESPNGATYKLHMNFISLLNSLP